MTLRRSFVIDFALALAVAASACKPERAADPAPAGVAAVPYTRTPVLIDGEWAEPEWDRVALRGVLAAPGGGEARPFSELRLLRDAETIYVALYAADEDIRSTDHFDVTIGDASVRVDPTGRVTPAIAGVHAAVDLDEGTIDRGDDDDEEWVVELAIPVAAIGAAPGAIVPVRGARCDTPKGGPPSCGEWRGELALVGGGASP